jgi:hypothetical protein
VTTGLLIGLLVTLIASYGLTLYRDITRPASYQNCTEVVLSPSANPVVKACR